MDIYIYKVSVNMKGRFDDILQKNLILYNCNHLKD